MAMVMAVSVSRLFMLTSSCVATIEKLFGLAFKVFVFPWISLCSLRVIVSIVVNG